MDNFEWDAMSSEEDFFAAVEKEENKTETTSAVIDEIDNDEVEVEIESPEGGKEEAAEEDLFAKVEEVPTENLEEEEEVETDKTNKPKAKKLDTVSTLNFLKEKGLVSFELGEEEELTEELAEDILEDSYENTIEERIATKLEGLPSDAKNLIQFVLKGGTMNQYLDQVIDNSIDIDEDIDLEDEKNQINVMRAVLELEGEDEDEIEERIEYLKDKGILASTSQKKFKKYLEEKTENEQKAIQDQAKARENANKVYKENRRNFSNYISEQKEIGGLPVPKKAKTDIPAMMFDKTIELENGGKITEMQKILFYEIPQNKAANTQLAILLSNRNEDGTFNFDAIAKKAETTVIKDVKDKVRRTNSVKGTTSSNKTVRTNKPLHSYFD